MAKIKTSPFIDGISGKACQHSEYSYRTNKKTGAVYSYRLCNPSEGGSSADQVAARSLFSQAAQAAAAVCKATSSDTPATNYTKQVAYRAQFNNQHKCGSFYPFVLKKEYAALVAAQG